MCPEIVAIVAAILISGCAMHSKAPVATARIAAVDKSRGDVKVTGGGIDSLTSILLAASVLAGAIGGGSAYPFVRRLRLAFFGDRQRDIERRVEALERGIQNTIRT